MTDRAFILGHDMVHKALDQRLEDRRQARFVTRNVDPQPAVNMYGDLDADIASFHVCMRSQVVNCSIP